jgi:cytochrome c oxidase assembly protein subunit 15
VGARLGHRLAWLTVAATLVVIVAGGLVTNTGAALAVPDWPTTFGQNMFLFPWSQMIGGVLFEHGHRLLGALVGVLTLAAGLAVWWTEPRPRVRTLALGLVGLVAVQGLLGGLRVVLLADALAVVHGCVAQAFLALATLLAVLTRPPRPAPPESPAAGSGMTGLADATVAAVYGQIVLGALATHAGWVGVHVGGALVVLAVGLALARRCLAVPAAGLARRARWWLGLLGAQLGLGLGAYVARFTGWALPGGELAVIGLPVVHRLTGALLLVTAVTMALAARGTQAGSPARASRAAGPLAAPGRVAA